MNKLDKSATVSSLHVFEYICDNSRKFEKEGLVHWSAASLNYTQKLAAHKCFEGSMALNELSERCKERENTPLMETYGAKELQKLAFITLNQFQRIAGIYEETATIRDWINRLGKRVDSILGEHISEVDRYTLLGQEHERELEHELEEQRQIFRPPSANASNPKFNPLLQELFDHGKSHNSFSALVGTKN